MIESNRGSRLIYEVTILFVIGIILTGIITYITESSLSDTSVRQQTEARTSELGEEAVNAIREYPASNWLLSYWYTHADEMDIEYDAEYVTGTKTEAKCRTLEKRYPDVQLKYASQHDIEAMAPKDQKLYAEVVYSWLLTRFNQIKKATGIDYLFCVVAGDKYTSQFFIMSAAYPGAKRGLAADEAYPLGKVVEVDTDRQQAMQSARDNSSYLANAGEFADYYVWVGEADGDPAFIGLTESVSELYSIMSRQARRETLYAMLLQLFLCAICLILIYFVVLRPLKQVQESIRTYRVTKDSSSVTENLKDIKLQNEIGELSDDVTDLAVEMDDYVEKIKTISAEKERIGTELSLATKIQASMVPHIFPAFPERSEFDIYGTMDPAKEVGGDFYDFSLVDDDHLVMAIADVSGKGIPAALFMMASMIILKGAARSSDSPTEILKQTNEVICSNNQQEMFVTVWLGILELSTGKLKTANAGHEYPALSEGMGRPFELMKSKHDFVIGGMPGMKYHESEMTLKPGAKLFIYTDGVTEAVREEGDMFGTDRVVDALNVDSGADPEHVLHNVRSAIDDFVKDAEQFDDMTMLCVEYRGK